MLSPLQILRLGQEDPDCAWRIFGGKVLKNEAVFEYLWTISPGAWVLGGGRVACVPLLDPFLSAMIFWVCFS